MSEILSRIIGKLACALAVALPFSGAIAAPGPVYNIPIDILGAQFYDGASLTGEFSLNQYGYPNPDWIIQVGAGHSLTGAVIPAFTFSSANGETLGPSGAPNTIEVTTSGAGNTPPILYLTFQHSLAIPGPNPLVVDANSYLVSPDSAECNGFSCTSTNERLISSGFAEVPEPASLLMLVSGAIGLFGLRRRRAA